VESTPLRGSRFGFNLPLDRVAAADGPSRPTPAPPALPTPSVENAPRVLLAEDNPVNRKVALQLLHRLGCQTAVVENGREAVAALDGGQYDLVLMDVRMPVMDGLEATRIIRNRQDLPQPLIVALTASVTQPERQTYLAAGMDGCLAKPLRFEQLAQIVQIASA